MTHQPPTALPQDLLTDPEMQDALASHDFGTVFHLARTRAGLSYCRIAAECDLNPSRVGTLARGEGRITSFGKIAQVADALRIPGRMVGLAPRPWEATTPPPRLAGHAAPVPALNPPGAPQHVCLDFVDELHRRTSRLRRLDDVLGGVETYPVYLAEYQTTRVLLRTSTFTPESRRRTIALLAEQAQQAGWAAFDAGRTGEAAGLFHVSKDAALEADEGALLGNAFAFLAYQTPEPNTAVEIATTSCATITSGTAAGVQALLHERKAFVCAVAGRADEATAALDAARTALHDQRDGQRQPDWAAWVNHTELDIMTGRCWTELQRPLRAVPVLTDALSRCDDTRARDKALFMSWLAKAYLTAGEAEEAAVVTSRALDLSAGVASVRLQQRLAPVLTQMVEHRHLTTVQQVLTKAAGIWEGCGSTTDG